MQMLNRYFTPFALALILAAVYFSEPEPRATKTALAVLVADVLLNWWIARNQYRWAAWATRLRRLQVWLNFIWAVPLFYLLYPYWAPMWLLFVMAPTAAALTANRRETTLCSGVSALAMLALYWARQPLEGVALGMALSHAAFIVIFSLFVHGLAQTALRMRDHNLT